MSAGSASMSRRLRVCLLVIGAMAAAVGFWTGLVRLGLYVPAGPFSATELHAALMISGFLGTVISLERAVAMGRPWAYGAPACAAIGALALLAGSPAVGAIAFIAASATRVLASISIAARQPAVFTIVLALGAACWNVGTVKWLVGDSLPAVAGWWLNFLILTIAAERLELSRLLKLSHSSLVAFAIMTLVLLLGSLRDELAADWAPLTGAGLLGCAGWLLVHDIARRTVRHPGLPRFSAASILIGHVWLGVAGTLFLFAPYLATAFTYDAGVHAIAIGFVLSMIFGHAPIIFPAITGIRIAYSRILFVPLIALHLSVVLRVGGDLTEMLDVRLAGGMLTVVALMTYAVAITLTARRTGLHLRT
jgi:hypothetical protein